MNDDRVAIGKRNLDLSGMVARTLAVNNADEQRLQMAAAKQRVRAVGENLHAKTTCGGHSKEINGSQTPVGQR